MGFLGRLIFQAFSNFIALYASVYFINGFTFTGGAIELIITAGVLTLINLLLRPVLKLVLGPFIILTLGLFIIVVNAITIYILDILIDPLTIQGYMPLFYASILIGIINFFMGVSGKSLREK